jgi:23S rRNA (cytidine1920-2'-O)/16S rRNA (cytidine1409-2'-O)-methyltransferase
MRLDVYLTQQGLVKSRSEATRLIKEGAVTLNGKVCTTPACPIEGEVDVVVDRTDCRYVSRGGLKLEAAIQAFSLDPTGHVALDIGASTGGFTHCLLAHGASKVYALENGHGQLDAMLLNRADVINLEHFNARNMMASDFEDQITFATMDVSFISQTLILPAVANVLVAGGTLVSLIKPQFEVGPKGINRKGIVKDEKTRQQAVNAVCECAIKCGFSLHGLIVSPVLGGDGNVEFLAHFVREGSQDE